LEKKRENPKTANPSKCLEKKREQPQAAHAFSPNIYKKQAPPQAAREKNRKFMGNR
jgi:hypothetical protein